jgi:Ring finger domain
LFSTGTNTIGLWVTDWDFSAPRLDGGIYRLLQAEGDGLFLNGIDANAVHILFSNAIRYEKALATKTSPSQSINWKNSATFSVSIYEDGSIRIRYHNVSAQVLPADVLGLWSARVSQDPDNRFRNYKDIIPQDAVRSASDVVYCPIQLSACLREACVGSGSNLSFVLEAGMPVCRALNADIKGICFFGDGSETPVIASSSSHGYEGSCEVPTLANTLDGDLVAVDIRWFIEDLGMRSMNADVSFPAMHTIQYLNGELSRTNIMIRYFSARLHEGCGCSPLVSSLTCDNATVCGGFNSVDNLDCNGDAFGSAYQDACGTCVGGRTLRTSSTGSCSDDIFHSSDVDDLMVLSETFVLIMIVCCMSCVMSTLSYFVRVTIEQRLLGRADELNASHERVRSVVPSRGLGEVEREALGVVIFSVEHLDAGVGSKAECSICLTEIEVGQDCRKLPDPCGHLFHLACIDQWFNQSVACPLCKRSLRDILEGGDGIVHLPPARRRLHWLTSPTPQIPPPPVGMQHAGRQLRDRGMLSQVDELASSAGAEEPRGARGILLSSIFGVQRPTANFAALATDDDTDETDDLRQIELELVDIRL